MRRTKHRVAPGVDVVESRVLLSAGAPVMTRHALDGVVRDVRAIVNTLARTDDIAQASRHLTRLSAKVPSGPVELAPAWRADLTLYRPEEVGSIGETESLILGDLYQYVGGLDGGGVAPAPVTGSGPSAPPSPAPVAGSGGSGAPVSAPSLDSVTIQNTTGLALEVTVYLQVPQVQKPWITQTIPAQGTTTVLFNFGSATDAFMTMNVSQANGSQTPTPFNDLSLSQPLGGYDGATFTISVLGSSFNVSPL